MSLMNRGTASKITATSGCMILLGLRKYGEAAEMRACDVSLFLG